MISGRTALVTGGGNGIGLAIGAALRAAGAQVVLAGRDLEKLERAAASLGSDVLIDQVDTADEGSVHALADRLSGREISILVNNAGVAGPVAPLWEITPDQWDDVFAVNVRGVYLMCRTFLQGMLERGTGDVINLASVSGKRPLARRTPYTASKMAVIGLTTTLAHEVGPCGVRVNTLSPGPVAGPRMTRNFAREAERLGVDVQSAENEFVSRAAEHRMVTEAEVAAAAIAMLSMTGLNGADIDLSAGMIAR